MLGLVAAAEKRLFQSVPVFEARWRRYLRLQRFCLAQLQFASDFKDVAIKRILFHSERGAVAICIPLTVKEDAISCISQVV